MSLNYLPSGKNSKCHTSLLCHEIGRVKKNSKFWCETRIVYDALPSPLLDPKGVLSSEILD